MRDGLAMVVCVALLTAAALAQSSQPVTMQTIPVAGNVSMLVGQGGNIGVSVGDDGVFMIDDQFAPLTGRIIEAVKQLSDKPIRFVVNTHWHFDHTGGNENFGKAGAVLVAHENVRKRMSTEQFIAAFNRKEPAAPAAALPVITFSDSVTFHWNGEEVYVLHVKPAHTDGDSIIYFKGANVLHMGDTFFNGMYPFIDTGAGGSIDGMISAVDLALGMLNKDTRIIPGHGPLASLDDLKAYRTMLQTAADAIRPLVKAGKSRDEVIAAKPTAALDEKWGKGFMKPDQWVGIVHDGMKK